MKSELLYSGIDGLNGKPYDVYRFNALELSIHLRNRYQKIGKNYNDYNGSKSESVDGSVNKEIYEYINFALFRKDGEFILLDGFRRLLLSDAPDMDISVRVYNFEELTEKEVLNLIVYYNQYKLIGSSGGSYYDRGFSLLIDVIYDINILEIKKPFIGYIERDYQFWEYDRYIRSNNNTLDVVKERILTDYFIEDLKFIKSLINEVTIADTDFFGALLFKLRKEGYRGSFDRDRFLADIKDNESIKNQEKVFNTYSDSRGNKAINELIKLYSKILLSHVGVETEKTYAEKLTDAKNMSDTLKKDKEYLKISGVGYYHNITDYFIKYGIDNVKVKVLIYPKEKGTFSSNLNEKDFEYGVYEDINIDLNNIEGRGIYKRQFIAFSVDDRKIGHGGYNGYYGYNKYWVNIRRGFEQKCEVYIKVDGKSKRELEKELKNWNK